MPYVVDLLHRFNRRSGVCQTATASDVRTSSGRLRRREPRQADGVQPRVRWNAFVKLDSDS